MLTERSRLLPSSETEAVRVDLRELASILDELAMISQRVGFFHRFLTVRGEVSLFWLYIIHRALHWIELPERA